MKRVAISVIILILLLLVFILTNPSLEKHKSVVKAELLDMLAKHDLGDNPSDSTSQLPESPIEVDLLMDKVVRNDYLVFSISEISLDSTERRLGIGLLTKVWLVSDFRSLMKLGLSAMRLRVGDFYAGGFIFSISQNGQHGLVAAPADLEKKSSWGCANGFVQGTLAAIGSGSDNTKLIVENCKDDEIAARLCTDLNLYGHDDWFLPSRDELNLIYENLHKKSLGGFKNDIYWSSTEYNNFSVWAFDFETGTSFGDENGIENVRPVRAF